jgi:hypothetical protein
VILPPAELLARLSTTLRGEIGPAIDGEYPRTQAFMAAVVTEKLARQLAVGPAHERADAADRAQLFIDLDLRLPAGLTPPDLRAIVDEGLAGGGTAVVCRMIEALYASEQILGRPSFDAALGRVRATLRARINRQMEYAG